jgi:hypothetical protein
MNSHMCDIWKMGHENLLGVLNACMGPMLRDLCNDIWKMGHENLLGVLNACMGPMLRDLCKRASSTC